MTGPGKYSDDDFAKIVVNDAVAKGKMADRLATTNKANAKEIKVISEARKRRGDQGRRSQQN